MFHPIYNQDGTVAAFRVLCLVIVAFCMMAYAVIFLGKSGVIPEIGEEVHSQSTVSDEEAKAEAARKKAEHEKAAKAEAQAQARRQETLRLEQVRNTALSELESGVHFLESCGAVNPGFEGCTLSFSKTVSGNYTVRSEAADDGFFILLEAQGKQLNDKCRTFFADSGGIYAATNQAGLDDPGCLPQAFMDVADSDEVPSFARATDRLQGFDAPSGMQPLSGQQELQSNLQLNSSVQADSSGYASSVPVLLTEAKVY